MAIGIRILHTTAEGFVRLMQALRADPDVRVIRGQIPPGAAIAGMRANERDHTIEIDIMSHGWPDNDDPKAPIEFMYARRYGTGGLATDWSAPIGVD